MTESAELPPASPSDAAPASVTDQVPPPLEMGTRVGSFELRRLISRGPSTAVYLAQDSTLGVDVAIKEFRLARGAAQPLTTNSPTHVQLEPAVLRGLRAFVEEARMLARCDHASLMAVRGLFESHGTAYRVMPHYTATALTELRASMPRPPDEPSVRAVLSHLLSALEALHANGQLHGAMVASNVLLLPDDRPLLLGPGSAALEAAFVQAAAQAQQHPGADAPLFADRVLGEISDLADLAEFCITGVQRPAGHVREAGDTVTAAIVRELGAVELRHYSPAFLSVLDAASSARSEDRPINTAQFANWLGSHELRRLKHQPRPTLVSTRADDSRLKQDEWAVTVPPAMWNEPAPELATPSPADREFAQPQDSVSTSQIWADTVQVIDDNPPPGKRASIYPPLPQSQARPNFEQRRWEARKWMAGLGAAGVGLIAALVYVVGGSKNATLPSDASAARSASSTATSVMPSAPNRTVVAGLPTQPAASNLTPEKPAPGVAAVAAATTEMPEIRLPVAEPFSAASAASATHSGTVGAAATVVAAATIPAALATSARAEPAAAAPVAPIKAEPKAPASNKPPKGVKISKTAWANGPRGVCSVRGNALAGSCLKTQCRTRKWAAHPQCTRAAGTKSAG